MRLAVCNGAAWLMLLAALSCRAQDRAERGPPVSLALKALTGLGRNLHAWVAVGVRSISLGGLSGLSRHEPWRETGPGLTRG